MRGKLNSAHNCRRLIIISAIALSLGLLPACKRSAQSYLASGQAYMQKGNYDAARIEFLNAVRQDPQSSEAQYRLGRAYLAEHDMTNALSSFESAAQLDPRNV